MNCDNDDNFSGDDSFTSLEGVIKIEDNNSQHQAVKTKFLSGMKSAAPDTEIVAVHKILTSGSRNRDSWWQSFKIYTVAMAKSRQGNHNSRFAWYAGSKDEIFQIISHGFNLPHHPPNGEPTYGGLSLFHENAPMYSAVAAEADRDGVKHVLLCRVTLGNMEVVSPGWNQFHPSSEEFDSGVDSLTSPRRYIVWRAFMNSHIFPFLVVSFKAPSIEGNAVQAPPPTVVRRAAERPNSPFMTFTTILSLLSKILDRRKMNLLTISHDDYRRKKIIRAQLVRRLRVIAGDELLAAVIKATANKESNGRRTTTTTASSSGSKS